MHIILSLLIVLSWGMNTAISKIGLAELPTFHLLTIRFMLTGLIFLPFAKLKKEQISSLLKVSLSFNVGHLGFIFLGLNFMTAASAASVQQLQVPMAVILSAMFLKEKVNLAQIMGIIIAILGVVIIYGIPDLNLLGFIFIILGAFFFAITQLFMKTSKPVDLPTFISYTSLFCVPFLMILSILFNEKANWNDVNYYKLSAVVLYQVLVLGFATALWQKLIEKYGVNKITPFSLLNAVFAIIGGIILLSETLTMHIAVGATVTIIGVALTTLFKGKKV